LELKGKNDGVQWALKRNKPKGFPVKLRSWGGGGGAVSVTGTVRSPVSSYETERERERERSQSLNRNYVGTPEFFVLDCLLRLGSALAWRQGL